MLSAGDKVVLSLMVFIPLAIVLFFVWFPALATVFLSFTTWSGIGGLKAIHADGIQNYHQIATNYPPFVPALEHNVLWLVVFIVADGFHPVGHRPVLCVVPGDCDGVPVVYHVERHRRPQGDPC